MANTIDISALSNEYSWPKDKQSIRVMSYVVLKALEMLTVKKIILYGSRARHENTPFSDFDIAIDAGGEGEAWTKFVLDVEENMETLLKVDLVEVNSIPDYLYKRIQNEGVILYEKK